MLIDSYQKNKGAGKKTAKQSKKNKQRLHSRCQKEAFKFLKKEEELITIIHR
jgi:hypothetical protein